MSALTYAEIQQRSEQLLDTLRARRFEHQFSEAQKHERALLEARMRANRLRRIPTCFGELNAIHD